MSAIIPGLIVILIISEAIALTFDKKIEQTIPVSILSIVILEYISGFVGNLKIGFIVSLVAAGISLVFVIHTLIKQKKHISVNPSIIIWFFIVLWIYIVFNDRMFRLWDEFSHWGLTIKIMYLDNAFSNNPGTALYFVDYPPGNSLFQYWILQFGGQFQEGIVSVAQGMFMTSFLVPIFSSGTQKNEVAKGIVHTFITAVMMISIPLGMFGRGIYGGLYVDATLGILFGYILYCHYTTKEDAFLYFNLMITCGVCCIVKPSGIGIVGLALICILIDNISRGTYRKENGGIKALLTDLSVPAFSLAVKIPWNIRLSSYGYERHFDISRITVKGIVNLLSGEGKAYQYETIHNFIDSFITFEDKSLLPKEYLLFITVFIALGVAIFLFDKEKRFIVLGISLTFAYIIYSLYLLLLYVFSYGEVEATRLASFERYEYTIIMGVFICLVGLLAWKTSDKTYSFSMTLVIAALLLICLPYRAEFILSGSLEANNSHGFREKYMIGDKIQSSFKKGDKFYIISQNSNGFDYFVLRYEMAPVLTQTRANDQEWKDVSYVLGQPNGDNDDNKRNISAEEWMKYLIDEQFDYVLVFRSNQQLVDEYGSLFEDHEIANEQIWRVNKESFRLELLEEQLEQST